MISHVDPATAERLETSWLNSELCFLNGMQTQGMVCLNLSFIVEKHWTTTF